MILHATSDDHGHTWTQARPIEVDSICSRMLALSGVGAPDAMVMVMNDHHARVPERISRDRYFLSLFCAPVCEPDLLLPGPVVQPEGGTAFYPNGFVADGRLHLAYTYPGGIHSSVVEPLPDFSEPFLLPRGSRPGLRIDGGVACLGQPRSSLGLVLTPEQTRQPRLHLVFDVDVHRYPGSPFPLLTLGGKTRQAAVLRAAYSQARQSDVLQVKAADGGEWADVAPLTMKAWHRVDVAMGDAGFAVSVDGRSSREVAVSVLRKLSFGGLYEPPEWPQGVSRSHDVRLRLDSLVIE